MSPESAISSPLAFPAAGFIEPGGLGAKATSTQLIICTVLIINSTRWLPALGWQRRAPEAGSSAKSFFFPSINSCRKMKKAQIISNLQSFRFHIPPPPPHCQLQGSHLCPNRNLSQIRTPRWHRMIPFRTTPRGN